MRYFDKLTNFFASTYINSPKHNSNFLSYLRIFFERNNKYKSTFAKLGNVFRNSKWSDLKIQNIKTPLISNWFSWALLLFTLSLIIFSFFGKSTISYFYLNVPFLSDISNIIFYAWANFINFISLSWIQLWLTVLTLKTLLLKMIGFNQNYMHKAFNVTESSDLTRSIKKSVNPQTLKLSPIFYYDTQSLILVHYVSKVNKSLGFLNNHYNITSVNHVTSNPLLNKMYSLMPDVVSSSFSSKVRFQIKEINNHTGLYTLTSSLQENWSDQNINSIQSLSYLSNPKFYTINSNILQTLNNQQFGIILNNLNIYDNLSQSKQDRWLLKNSLLSNSSVTDLNAFTQAKKLLGVNLFESSHTSRNIWNSSKLTQLTQTEELQKLSLFQSFLGLNKNTPVNILSILNEGSSGIQSFNFFETSSLWTTKKYFFTNQLKFNHTVISQSLTNVPFNPKYNQNTLFTFSSNLHNTVLSNQLNKLNNSFHLLHADSFNFKNTTSTNSFFSLEEVDLLKSINLNVINTLTLPITNKDTSINNYTNILPLMKSQKLHFKK